MPDRQEHDDLKVQAHQGSAEEIQIEKVNGGEGRQKNTQRHADVEQRVQIDCYLPGSIRGRLVRVDLSSIQMPGANGQETEIRCSHYHGLSKPTPVEK